MDLRTPYPAPARRETGFSMVELMVVLTILAILIAVAVPTLLGATRPSADRRAETILHTALLAGRAAAGDRGTYVGVRLADLAAGEYSLRFVAAGTEATSVRNEVSVRTGRLGASDFLLLASRSASGRCFALLDRTDAATAYRTVEGPTSCRTADLDPAAAWSPER